MRENLETYLAGGEQADAVRANVPFHVEATYRQYRKCGILAHGFCRVYCAYCRHDFLVAFRGKGRDICPSCATRRMVKTAAHMVDNVLPWVPYRQWVLSVPKRVRWHLRTKPEVISGLLGVFLRAVETPIRQNSPDAPPGARFVAVAFVHRFGSYLNSHVHFHVLVTDGVFSADNDGAAIFHPAVDLDQDDHFAVQRASPKAGSRSDSTCATAAVHALGTPDRAGGWSVDASVTLPAGATLQVLQETHRQMGLEDEPPAAGAGDRFRRTAARCWALLLARIYECLPLQCPRCGQPMRIIAFDQDDGRDDWPEMDQSADTPGDPWG